MKKLIIILIVLAVAGGGAWYLLLRPESVSQDTVTQYFEAHRQAYEDIAGYLTGRNITAEIRDIPDDGDKLEGVEYEDSEEYRKFIRGIREIMEDNDAVISDGKTVEFVCHSTGGMFMKLAGSVIYNGEKKVEGRITAPLTSDGWHLYIAQG